MKCKAKYFYITPILLLFCIYSCDNKTNTTDYVKKIIGLRIKFEKDMADTLKESKILILMPDTGDCTTCAMQIYDWYIYKLDLDKHGLKCDILYILNDSVILNKSIGKLMEHYKLHYKTNLNSFYSNNRIFKKIPFTTFLIDKYNKIKLVGFPINNDKLWKLYKQTLHE